MEPLFKPISALRIFTLAVTILLIAVFFLLPKGSPATGFLVGLAAGLSVSAHVMLWHGGFQWRGEVSSARQ